jgi:hypothetical protein
MKTTVRDIVVGGLGIVVGAAVLGVAALTWQGFARHVSAADQSAVANRMTENDGFRTLLLTAMRADGGFRGETGDPGKPGDVGDLPEKLGRVQERLDRFERDLASKANVEDVGKLAARLETTASDLNRVRAARFPVAQVSYFALRSSQDLYPPSGTTDDWIVLLTPTVLGRRSTLDGAPAPELPNTFYVRDKYAPGEDYSDGYLDQVMCFARPSPEKDKWTLYGRQVISGWPWVDDTRSAIDVCCVLIRRTSGADAK